MAPKHAGTLAPMTSAAMLPDEDPDLRVEAAKIFDDADLWFDTPHADLGGLSPRAAVRQGRDPSVRNVLRNLKYIGMS